MEPARLFTPEEAASYLGLKVRTLEAWRWSGKGPQFVRLSSRAVRYRPCDLDEYVAERLARSTSEQ